MKETGMTRRIDELGRVVIPKEIREKLKLRVGTPVEIFIDGGDLGLRRYPAAPEYVSLAFRTADALAKTTGHTVVMTENEKVIAAGGRRGGEFLNAFCRPAAEHNLTAAENIVPSAKNMTAYAARENGVTVLLLAEGEITPSDRKAAELAAELFGAAIS